MRRSTNVISDPDLLQNYQLSVRQQSKQSGKHKKRGTLGNTITINTSQLSAKTGENNTDVLNHIEVQSPTSANKVSNSTRRKTTGIDMITPLGQTRN